MFIPEWMIAVGVIWYLESGFDQNRFPWLALAAFIVIPSISAFGLLITVLAVGAVGVICMALWLVRRAWTAFVKWSDAIEGARRIKHEAAAAFVRPKKVRAKSQWRQNFEGLTDRRNADAGQNAMRKA